MIKGKGAQVKVKGRADGLALHQVKQSFDDLQTWVPDPNLLMVRDEFFELTHHFGSEGVNS